MLHRRFTARGATLLVAALALCSLPVRAQEDAGDPPSSIDGTIRAVYAVISGPAGERDWDRFRDLFVADARLISMRRNPDGSPAAGVLTVEGYIERAGAMFRERPFYERELARKTEVFGAVAHAFSTYAAYADLEGEPISRGVNSIQLAREGDRWQVVTILWDTEREGQPIPAEYLP